MPSATTCWRSHAWRRSAKARSSGCASRKRGLISCCNANPPPVLDELRAAIALNEKGVPAWLADMHARLDALSQRFAAEVEQVRKQLEHVAQRAAEAMDRIEQASRWHAHHDPVGAGRPGGSGEAQQVGLGERCSMVDRYAALKERHHDLTMLEFHAGLKGMREQLLLTLLSDVPNGDAPGPETPCSTGHRSITTSPARIEFARIDHGVRVYFGCRAYAAQVARLAAKEYQAAERIISQPARRLSGTSIPRRKLSHLTTRLIRRSQPSFTLVRSLVRSRPSRAAHGRQ